MQVSLLLLVSSQFVKLQPASSVSHLEFSNYDYMMVMDMSVKMTTPRQVSWAFMLC